MQKGKLKYMVISGVMAGSLLAGAAFAAGGSDAGKMSGNSGRCLGEKPNGQMMNSEDRQEKMQELLDQLVEDGTLTQAKADSIMDFMEGQDAKRQEQMEKIKSMTAEEREALREEQKESGITKRERGGFWTELVDEGILTQDEVDEIQDKQQEKRKAEQTEMMNGKLNELVEDEIITQDQADEIVEFLQERSEERKAEMEKLKEMTEEERQEYFQENKGQHIQTLKEIVEEEIITQDQADELAKVLPLGRQGHGPGGAGARRIQQQDNSENN